MSLESVGSLSVQLARAEDYPAIAALHNADNEPHFQATPAQLQQSDAANLNGGRIVALQDGAVIGTAAFWLWSEVEAYRIGIHTVQDAIGADAATQLLIDLERRTTGAKRLLSTVRSDFLGNAHHLQLGFNEVFRSFGANLELANFNSEHFNHLETDLLKQSIQIIPRSEWLLPDVEAQLEAIQLEGNADIPSYEPVVTNQMDFKTRTLLEAFWVALFGDECVGFVSLDGKPDQPVIHFDSSAVLRSHRNRRIGLALAARAVAWAKAQGFAEVNDGGAKSNFAHIKILERLGFELEPDWVTYEKVFG